MISLRSVERVTWHMLGNVVLALALLVSWVLYARLRQDRIAQIDEARGLLTWSPDTGPGFGPWERERARWLKAQER